MHERNMLRTLNIRNTNWIGHICVVTAFLNMFLNEM
jgi:hypothetical protein